MARRSSSLVHLVRVGGHVYRRASTGTNGAHISPPAFTHQPCVAVIAWGFLLHWLFRL
jgi:hypothetical protein